MIKRRSRNLGCQKEKLGDIRKATPFTPVRKVMAIFSILPLTHGAVLLIHVRRALMPAISHEYCRMHLIFMHEHTYT